MMGDNHFSYPKEVSLHPRAILQILLLYFLLIKNKIFLALRAVAFYMDIK